VNSLTYELLAVSAMTLTFWLRVEHRLTLLEERLDSLFYRPRGPSPRRSRRHGSCLAIAAFLVVLLTVLGCGVPSPQKGGTVKIQTRTNLVHIVTPENPDGETTVTTRDLHEVTTILPASQKDVARTESARAAALRPVQIIGILLVLVAVLGFTPWVRPIIGSTTTTVLIGVVGVALIVLCSLLPRASSTWLIAVPCFPLIWWIAHRHGQLKAAATTPPVDNATKPK